MRGGGVCWDMTSTCVQGGFPRPLGGYQPNVIMEPHSPAPAWNMHQSVVPKQEPVDDSGINSGSDFHSSSPGSDNSQDYNPAFTTPNITTIQTPYYSSPVTTQYVRQNNFPFHLGFNPLTPPSSEPMVSPKAALKPDSEQDSNTTNNTTLTPHASPTPQEPKTPSSTESEQPRDDLDDPLRRLQMTFEKNEFLPSALSPKTTSEHSGDDENKESWEESDESFRMPSVNTHGKVKTFKCKQCEFVTVIKNDFWVHSKGHIKADKLLTCPKCPFVTEYKHHLEYHLRNHFGSKPFKCDKCNYSCVNKSMLNSHAKSHSNIYQYRCQDCSYATKYCHSLKLHLRKYNHKPAMVLNPDGTPNPLPIIDVYGTRRGPKQKGQHMKHEQQYQEMECSPVPQTPSHQQQPMANNPFLQFMNFASQGGQMPFPYPFFPGALGNQLLLAQQLAHQQNGDNDRCFDKLPPSPYMKQEHSEESDSNEILETSSGALDLSKPEAPAKNRRKGKAFKLERSIIQSQSDEESDFKQPQEVKTGDEMEEIAETSTISTAPVASTTNISSGSDWSCKFCGIAFGDVVLYTMHMGYHGYKDPFTCNMCGEQCNDKVAFFLHIARNPHT